MGPKVIFAIVILSMLLLVALPTARGDGPVPVPAITEVSAGQSNTSGWFRFNLYLNGTTQGRAAKLNFTFSASNATDEVKGPWIDPLQAFFLGNGIIFRSAGNSSDPWSRWNFRFGLYIPSDSDPEAVASIFSDLLGLNISVPENTTVPEVDIENTTISFLVRAYGTDGSYTEARRDITRELLMAFDIPQGAPLEPRPDPPGEDEGDGGPDILPIAIVLVGIIVLASIAVAVIIRGRKPGGMGYRHERI